MVSTIASLGVLVSANVAPAMKSMDQMGNKVKDVGQTAQKEGAKTESFMKKWSAGFAMIGAAAAGALYMIVKASPLLAGAMQEAQDAISLLFMTIGDALEPVLRPFVDALWGLSDVVIGMPAPIDAITAGLITFGGAIVAAAGGLALIGGALKAFGIGCASAGLASAALVGALGGIVLAAGLVSAALYELSGDPTVAITGALTAIGIGATVLMHHPVIFAITSIISAFVLMAGEADALHIAASAAFLAIGVAATALMGHPLIAAFTAVVGAIALIALNVKDMETAVILSFTAIGIAASVLLANPIIAAVTAVLAAIALLEAKGITFEGETFTGVGFPALEEIAPGIPWPEPPPAAGGPYQHGGYIPFTGRYHLEAGEHVTRRGATPWRGDRMRTIPRVVSGPVYNVDYHPVIEIAATVKEPMDVEKIKQTLDEIYRREMGGLT